MALRITFWFASFAVLWCLTWAFISAAQHLQFETWVNAVCVLVNVNTVRVCRKNLRKGS
jgi:hypothetical protein